MSAPTLGARYLNACAALGVFRPQREGMALVHPHSATSVVMPTDGWMPDFRDPGTLGHALDVYDALRAPRPADPVYAAAAAHGLASPETQEAIVEALEQLAAERAACGGAP
jgi:hypothetical protein